MVAVVAGLVTIAAPDPARAEGRLAGADPPADAVLATAPTEVTLRFGERIDAGRSYAAVLDPAGRWITDRDQLRVDETRLRLPVRIEATGDYTVAYRVTLADGDTVTGAHRFSVGTGAPPAALDGAFPRDGADLVSRHAHDDSGTHGHTVDLFSAILLVVDGVVLAAVLGLLWLRPRGGRRPMSLRGDPRF